MVFGRQSQEVKWIQKEINKIELSKPIKIFFVIIRGVFMLDFGFIRSYSKKWNLLLRVLTLIQLVTITVIFEYVMFSKFAFEYAFWWNLYVLEYYFNVTILLFCNKRKSLCTLFGDLLIADEDMGLKLAYSVELKMIIYITFTFIYNVGLWMTHCNFFPAVCNLIPNYYYWLYILFLFGPNLPLMIYLFLFYAVYCRLKQLRIIIEKSHYEIISSHILYKFLIDATERSKEIFDYLFLSMLIMKVPEIILTILNIIREFKDALDVPYHHLLVYTPILQYLSLLILPALCATKLEAEASKIKIILHDKLLFTKDHNQVKEIKRFIQYIKTRPFQFLVCNLIPLNSKLLLTLVNVHITYVIVAAQLSHLY